MNPSRTSRLAHKLLSRQAVHYDIATKKRLPFKNRSQALTKYKGRSDVFGSFTRLAKLGFNPKTTFNTPIGVYSYPIDYIIENAYEDIFSVPFAADAPYLHIFSVSGLDRALKFDKNDTAKVNEFKAEAPDDFESEDYNEEKALVLRINNYVNSTFDEIPDRYQLTSGRPQWNTWYEKLKKTTGFNPDPDDPISSIIVNRGMLDIYQANKLVDYGEFPLQRVLEDLQDHMVRFERSKTVMFPYEDRIIELPEVTETMNERDYAHFKADTVLGEGERIACDQAFAWNCTRHLSGLNPSKWTTLMREIGLIGAVDDGTGTIHPNETTQAIFFDPSSVKILEVIQNEPPVKRSDRPEWRHLSEWAEEPEGWMPNAISSFKSDLFHFMKTGSRTSEKSMFVDLSWLQKNGQKFFKDNPRVIEGLIHEIYTELDNPFLPGDRKVLNKVIQILQRFQS